MGVRFPSVASSTFIGPLPANANETIVFTTPPLNISLDGAPIFLFFSVDISAGTSVTAHRFLIRRGSALTGASVMVSSLQKLQTPPNRDVSTGWYFDIPGAVAGQQYTLTIQQIGATVAGAFNDGCLLAFAL